MSRSLSLASPPVTNACASTTERVPGGRRGRRAPGPSRRRAPRRGCARRSRARRAPRRARGRAGRRRPPAPAGSVEQHRRCGRADGRCAGGCRRASISSGAEAEPAGRVVVAADQHDPGAGAGQPAQRVVAQRDGVDRRQRPVVDVAGDQHRVDPLGPHRLDQEVDEPRLGADSRSSRWKDRPEVPVGGVQQAHATTVGRGLDRTPRRRCAACRAARCARSCEVVRTGAPGRGRHGAGRRRAGSSPARTGSATGRRCGAAWTSSPGCSPSPASTPSAAAMGLEIELNLTDERRRPGDGQRQGPGPDRRPRLPDRAGPVQHRDQHPAAAARRARSSPSSRRTSAPASTTPTTSPTRPAPTW